MAQRVQLWRQRLDTAQTAPELIERYETARRACELPDWKAERTFLKLLQQRIASEGDARSLLRHFVGRPEVQKYVGKLILRRVTDERIVAAVQAMLFGSAVKWNEVDLELQLLLTPEERLAKLRELAAQAPEDPQGDIRLIKLLVQMAAQEEALARGRRLRDQGLLTLGIARQLGDVLARAGLEQEAVRTYSEIVEFDPHAAGSRRLLGDIYLGRGWYEPAYRQYKTLTEAHSSDALGWLRLAAAAAGTGRVDEALRLERRVATAQGRPGPADPRRWARLQSAARLGRLLASPPKDQPTGSKEGMERKLKELGVFSGPGALVVLTWEQLDADVLLVSRLGEEDVALGQVTDASPVGLSAVLLSAADRERIGLVARLRSRPREEKVSLWRHEIQYTGKQFTVKVDQHELAAGETSVDL